MNIQRTKQFMQSGITLIELLVVIAIFVVVAGVLMFNYSSFQTGVSVRNLSQEIALAIRKGQTYATSVRLSDNGTFNTDSFAGYGIAFSSSTPQIQKGKYNVDNKNFILFADFPDSSTNKGDRLYEGFSECGTPHDGQECVEMNSITSGDIIKRICYEVSTSPDCITTSMANVMFKRPVPDADICIVQGGACKDIKVTDLQVTIQSAQGQTKTIKVWNTGQISVN